MTLSLVAGFFLTTFPTNMPLAGVSEWQVDEHDQSCGLQAFAGQLIDV